MPRDTERDARENPMGLIFDAISLGTDGFIESQEAQGQVELCQGTELPTRGSEDPALAKMGIVFGDPNPADPMFRTATLPEGWSVRPTDHPMWSELMDDRGRVRAGIFYKAAFYDRRANICLTRRYVATSIDPDDGLWQAIVRDNETGETVFSSDVVEAPAGGYDDAYFDAIGENERVVREWLEEHHPDHRDASAYWDDDRSEVESDAESDR